jgi:hypothetical protein
MQDGDLPHRPITIAASLSLLIVEATSDDRKSDPTVQTSPQPAPAPAQTAESENMPPQNDAASPEPVARPRVSERARRLSRKQLANGPRPESHVVATAEIPERSLIAAADRSAFPAGAGSGGCPAKPGPKSVWDTAEDTTLTHPCFYCGFSHKFALRAKANLL